MKSITFILILVCLFAWQQCTAGTEVDYKVTKNEQRYLPMTAEVRIGHEARISCVPNLTDFQNITYPKVESIKDLSYWWFNNDNSILSESDSDSGAADLILQNVQPDDSGHYQCQIRDSYGDTIVTYDYELQVYTLPSFTYDTVFYYNVSGLVCDPSSVNAQAQVLWKELCHGVRNKKKNCMYTLRPKCGLTASTYHQWEIKITSNIKRHEVIENHPKCHGILNCVVRKEQGPVENLVESERDKNPDYDKHGVIFIDGLSGTHLNTHCRSGYSSPDGNKCYPCSPGYFNKDGELSCEPCPKNSYNTGYAQVECYKCPLGKATKHNATASLDGCIDVREFLLFNMTNDDSQDITGSKKVKERSIDAGDRSVHKREVSHQDKLIAAIGAITFMVIVIGTVASVFICCASCGGKNPEHEDVTLLKKSPSYTSSLSSVSSSIGNAHKGKAYSHYTTSVSSISSEDIKSEKLRNKHNKKVGK